MRKFFTRYKILITGLIFVIIFAIVDLIFLDHSYISHEIHQIIIRIAIFSIIITLVVVLQYVSTQRIKSEEKYRLITENANDLISVINEKFEIEFYNEIAYQKLLGYSSSETIGKSLLDFINPQDLDRVVNLLKLCFKIGKAEDEIRVKGKSGEYYWFEVNGKSFIDTDAKKKGIIVARNIDEKKKAEQNLRDSEEKFAKVFHASPNILAITRMQDGIVIDINEGFTHGLGYNRGDIVGIKTFDLGIWVSEISRVNFVRAIREQEEVLEFETQFKAKSGEIRIVLISGARITLNDEPHLITIAIDITDLKKAERKLRDSEEKFRTAVKNSPDYIIFINREGTIFEVNRLEKGFTREMVFGQSLFNELFFENKNQIKVVRKAVNDSIQSGETTGYETTQIAPDGSYSFYETKVSPFEYDDEDRLISLQLTIREITERKAREKEILDMALFPSEDPYPILRVNRTGIIYINDAGQKLLNLIDYSQIPNFLQENVKITFKSNQIMESEAEFDGRTYSFTIRPVKDQNYVNIYGMDITERKHIEENLKEVNKLKSEFLRRASHELKTPLISIKGFSNLLLTLHSEEFNSDAKAKLVEINHGCERLEDIIKSLIESSRLESSEIKLQTSMEDLAFLIRFCLNELQPFIKSRNHMVTANIEEKIITRFNKEQMYEVISNLLSNAVKYTPPYGEVKIKTELNNNEVIVKIRDNGIGFTQNEKEKVFQQFGKIERYGQGFDLETGGSGLGLYISKKIVESHGGKIWLESKGRSRGSTFYFSLPLIEK
ncbi:MAG: Signal transduction histidine kinase [Candidatus Lokiarchaeum sp. GC14_75]|nr:MAG: Signal transduction histidine kinase [Candidatus Lokiarchaeum sp. GC14_75]